MKLGIIKNKIKFEIGDKELIKQISEEKCLPVTVEEIQYACDALNNNALGSFEGIEVIQTNDISALFGADIFDLTSFPLCCVLLLPATMSDAFLGDNSRLVKVILVNDTFVTGLTEDQQNAVLWHEMGHVLAGHLESVLQGKSDSVNNILYNLDNEIAADRVAADHGYKAALMQFLREQAKRYELHLPQFITDGLRAGLTAKRVEYINDTNIDSMYRRILFLDGTPSQTV